LTGPKKLTIYCPTVFETKDLGTMFTLGVNPDGKISRAQACINQLKELNPFVEVSIFDGKIDESLIKQFDIVYMTELMLPMARIYELDKFCNAQTPAIGFILTLSLGLYGFTFVDYGPKLIVKDATGENPDPFIITLITQENPGIVSVHEDKKHDFQDGDYVKFREVEGMTELNSSEPMKIKVISKTTFSICDTTKFSAYKRAGIVEKAKMPQELVFKTLVDSLMQPLKNAQDCLINTDLSRFGRAEQLHIGLRALLEFHKIHNALPGLNNEVHAKEVFELAQTINEEAKKVIIALVIMSRKPYFVLIKSMKRLSKTWLALQELKSLQ
jgi:ubiquitin-activating enzyme E1